MVKRGAALVALWLCLAPSIVLAYTLRYSEAGAPIRWNTARVEVHLHQSLESQYRPGEARRALEIAVDAWRGVGGPDLVLVPETDTRPYMAGRAGVQVAFADPWPFDRGPLAVTVTSHRASDGVIVDSDILVAPGHALELLDEADPNRSRFDLASVLAHELGHVLGLGESEDSMATMWPRTRRGTTHARVLAADDEEGIAALYPQNPRTPEVTTYGCASPGSVPRGSEGLGVLFAGVLALVMLRRAPAWGSRRRRVARALGVSTVMLAAAPAWSVRAEDRPDARHRLEVAAAVGASLLGDHPEEPRQLDPGGALGGRALVDLGEASVEAWAFFPDPSQPERFQLRGRGRLFFLTLHDLTLRRSASGELLRVLAGLGGELALPDDAGHLIFDVGVAAVRLGSTETVTRSFSESYGAYVGLALHLRAGEVRNDLRLAVHGLVPLPLAGSGFSLDAALASVVGGVTTSNRLYVQSYREGAASAGPELHTQVEMLVEGLVVVTTVGIAGVVGL